jgi:type IV fimbrial biogenesis protein FimT
MQQPSTKIRSAKVRGFTLIELVIVLAIVATLCTISMPSLASLVSSTRARSAQNTLVTTLALARTAALSRQTEITLCPSSDQNHCDPGLWWHHGWIVFEDRDHDGQHSANEPLLNAEKTQTQIAIATTIGRDHVTYRPDGSAAGTNVTFTLCDRRGAKYASTVIISNTGRARHAPATAAEAAAACAGLQ